MDSVRNHSVGSISEAPPVRSWFCRISALGPPSHPVMMGLSSGIAVHHVAGVSCEVKRKLSCFNSAANSGRAAGRASSRQNLELKTSVARTTVPIRIRRA
jgi:hypothetical protein